MSIDGHDPDQLLRPREVAKLFGVRPLTITRWARSGKLTALRTPGGHRRYNRQQIWDLLAQRTTSQDAEQRADDAVRMYQQGWSIRQVAEEFDCSYGVMRRLLRKRTTLRRQGGPWGGRDSRSAP